MEKLEHSLWIRPAIKFKEESDEQELLQSSMVLQQISTDFALLSHFYGVCPVVTRVWGKIAGDSGVHSDKRAIDFRDEFQGSRLYSDEQVEGILRYLNAKWGRNDGFPTAIHHAFKGGPKHFHLQIPTLTKAYELDLNERANVETLRDQRPQA